MQSYFLLYDNQLFSNLLIGYGIQDTLHCGLTALMMSSHTHIPNELSNTRPRGQGSNVMLIVSMIHSTEVVH